MGLDSIPPGTANPGNVVTRKVFISNVELSNEILIAKITVNKTFNKISYAKVVFIDGSAAERNFTLSNDDRFKPGNDIKIQLGYDGNADTVFEGIIIKHGIKIRQSGGSLLIIEAKDKAIKLTGTRKSAYYINKLDSDVISTIASTLQPVIDPTQNPIKQLVQFESTDWDFICTRAEANSMLVLTDDNKLIVKKPSVLPPAVLTATYGQNINEFEAEMDARRQISSVTGQSWDYSTQQLETSGTGSSDFSENGNLSSTELGSVIGAQVKLSHPGHLTQTQLQDWANAYALRNKISKAVGRVRISGNSAVKPGKMITLAGVGDRFNGNVFVTGILHHFEGSWVTDIQFGWNDDWFYHREKVIEKPASGLLPGINGLHIGKVISTNDTEEGGQYRIQVHVPTISPGTEGIWARVAALDAGPERGSYFRPQEHDEVVLGFLNDDPREAIVLGYLHSKDTNKSPLPETEGMLEYGFVTKEKMKLVFDDSNKRVTLSAKTAAGEKTVILNNESGALELKDENTNTIKMDSSGITIQSDSGIITIKGTQVLINS
jgi:Rhs element Vgr protein